MKPIKINLYNIGPFINEEIDFSDLGKLFLITGETGSGKTFIFDAMTYALYGETSGTRGDLKNESLISTLKKDGEDSFVSFTFELDNTQYKITRYLEKNSTPKTLTSFLEISNDGGKTFEMKSEKAEAKNDLKQIIKLDKKDFSQIVLLPQGKFEEFLTSDSDDKRKILEKIFDVKKFSAIVNEIKKETKNKENEIDMMQNQIEAIGKSEEELSHEFMEKTAIQKEYEKIRNEGNKTLQTLFSNYTTIKTELENSEKKDDAEKKLKIENEKQNEIDKKRILLSNAKRASFAEESLHKKQESEKKFSEKKLLLENAKSEKEKSEMEYKKALENSKQIPNLEAEIKSIAVDEKKYDSLLKKVLELEEKTNETNEAEKKYNESKVKFDDAKEQLFRENKKIPEEQNINKFILKLKDDISNFSLSEQTLKTYLENAIEIEKLESEIKTTNEKLEEELEKIKKIENEISELNEKIEKLEKEKKLSNLLNQASILAKELKEGVKCPVCGSTHHPSPATEIETKDFDLEIEKIKKLLEEKQNEKENSQKEFAKENGSLYEKNSRLEKLNKNSNQKTKTEIEKELEKIKIQIFETTKKINSFSELSITIKNLEDEIENLKEETQNFRLDLESKNAAKNELLKYFENEESSKEKLEHKFMECKNILNEKEKLRDNLQNELSAAMQKKEKDSATETAITKQFEELKETLNDATHKFKEKLTESNFGTEDELISAIMEKTEIEKIENEITAHEKNIAELQTTIKTIGETRSSLEIKNEKEKIENDINLWQKKYEEADEKLSSISQEIGNVSANLEIIKNCRKRIDLLNEEWTVRKYLYDIFVKKIQLDTWALGAYYKNIVNFASRRFERFSSGRYKLEQNLDYSLGRANSDNSLDLKVFDSFIGTTREIKSLSGGERFEASLSLALAITDSVQYELDSIFIDEGFGTLDSKTREKVMPILQELKETKTVGIISHVESFREEIPNQIQLLKTENGSKIKIVT